MAKPLLMFTWTDVRDALETLAETPHRRRAAWLLERLKTDSEALSPGELLQEIVNSAILLGAGSSHVQTGSLSLLDG